MIYGELETVNVPGMGRSVLVRDHTLVNVVLEHCPVIDISEQTMALLMQEDYEQWSYAFQRGDKTFFALGLMALVNHKTDPNCEVLCENDTARLITLRDIPAGEHLSIWYENISDYTGVDAWVL